MSGMTAPTEPPDEQAILVLTEAAVREFREHGTVSSIHCDVCGGLIDLKWLGNNRSAISIKCPCGRFHGALRGILESWVYGGL
jgi:hypothetical protein